MATSIRFSRKLYTRWDETDKLKKMKDSDILAEKERSNRPTLGGTLSATGNAATSMLAGGAIGAGIGGVSGLVSPKSGVGRLTSAGNRASKLGKAGLIAGGALTAYNLIKNKSKKAEENEFYNKRLEYAKRQALRRERKDWKTNMTQRDGYTY